MSIKEPDYRKLLLNFIGSLTLCDHMGDVSNDVNEVLEQMGLNIEWEDWPDLAKELHAMGAETVWGTALYGPEDGY